MSQHRSVRGRHQQPSRHPKVHDPLGIRDPTVFKRAIIDKASIRTWSQFNNDVLSGPMHRKDRAIEKTPGLPRRGCFEGLTVGAKPDFHNPIAAYPGIDSPRDGLHLR